MAWIALRRSSRALATELAAIAHVLSATRRPAALAAAERAPAGRAARPRPVFALLSLRFTNRISLPAPMAIDTIPTAGTEANEGTAPLAAPRSQSDLPHK
jgi:hypothetical protein